MTFRRHLSGSFFVRSAMTAALTAAMLGVPAPPGRADPRDVPLGAFLGSGAEGVRRVAGFAAWLGRPVTVGHTYLPGETWAGVEGPPEIVGPWAAWRAADPRRTLVVNVPMFAANEKRVPDAGVAVLLWTAARGAFDRHFAVLARRLVAAGAGDAIIVPGWEMNGITYTHRCGPNPEAWKRYWRRIVATMRAAPGARFRFDFTPSRGTDAIGWTACYPGDDVVDVIGSDSYDQPAGRDFAYFVGEPYGLAHHADFARAHGKPLSFPEWGLFRNGDNPEYVRGMIDWIGSHDVAYQTISDYCPHGVWRCAAHPRSAEVYRRMLGSPATAGTSSSGTAAGSPAASATSAAN
ncbi:glycoside hydrolase family 26 protein [Thermomonospora umbrina]|uniref:Glycosyl hydrolase family 26 n=1 Tax=Thermomonospora umbrina TaxID=111806 RepID=A0A3D9SUK9_9ACTN|nr:glycosyl hydrolase [Thermomonospora umbrina]REE97713.1 glycosyl hydrolase family 26 [Thermomonospora umbrina]